MSQVKCIKFQIKYLKSLVKNIKIFFALNGIKLTLKIIAGIPFCILVYGHVLIFVFSLGFLLLTTV